MENFIVNEVGKLVKVNQVEEIGLDEAKKIVADLQHIVTEGQAKMAKVQNWITAEEAKLQTQGAQADGSQPDVPANPDPTQAPAAAADPAPAAPADPTVQPTADPTQTPAPEVAAAPDPNAVPPLQ